MVRVLIFEEDKLMYREGRLLNCESDMVYDVDACRNFTGSLVNPIYLHDNLNLTISNVYGSKKIKLDDATMRKISKFNKEVEIENLQKDIEYHERQLAGVKEDIEVFKRQREELESLRNQEYSEVLKVLRELVDGDDCDYDY